MARTGKHSIPARKATETAKLPGPISICIIVLALVASAVPTQAQPTVPPVTVTCTGPGNANCCSSNAICFYMKPNGSDHNNGTSEEEAVKTLRRVEQLVQEYGPINTHIEIRIKRGTYQQPQAMQWTYYTPGYYISFMPSDYKWGGWGSFEARPVFSGSGSKDSNWFEFFAGPGEWTRLAFYYLEVRNYARGGIVFEGPGSGSKWNGYNYVYGMYFTNLGTKWARGPIGYAGVFLVNSRNNFIKNNHFVNLENDSTNQGAIHAVYMKNGASNNLIRDNRMYVISGDAIRVRNESNDNDIRGNVMTRTGKFGFYSDWYNDPSHRCAPAQHTGNQECPSRRNWFRYNSLNCGYDGVDLPSFYFYQDRDCVPPGCDNLKDDRLQTASNLKRCP